jgi:hypothetical protein
MGFFMKFLFNRTVLQKIIIIFILTVCAWGVTSDIVRFDAFIVPVISALVIAIAAILLFHVKALRRLASVALGEAVDPLPESGTRVDSRTAIGAKSKAKQPVRSEDPAKESKTTGLIWLIGGLVFLAGCTVVLEIRQPFFFAQDDNFAIGVPVAINAYRSVLAHVFPAWNPHEMMGLPIMSNPQNSLLYPPMFISYLIARFVIGQEAAVLDVFSIMHLIGLYLVVFYFARYLKMRPFLASLCGLSVALSGFCLILGRSWANVPPYLIFMTLMCWQALRLSRGARGWSWAVWTGLLISAGWYLGNPQFWVYNMVFFALLILALLISKSLAWKRLFWILPCLCIGLAISAPIMIPQMMETREFYSNRSATTSADIGEGIECGILNMLVPCSITNVPQYGDAISVTLYGPVGWPLEHYENLGQFYYTGTLFAAVALLLLLSILVIPVSSRIIRGNPLLFVGLFALILALGEGGLLFLGMLKLPGFGGFRGPFKFLGHLDLFICLGAGVAIERIIDRYRAKWLEVPMLLLVAGTLAYQCSLLLPAFYIYDNHFPPLPTSMKEMVGDDQSVGQQRVFACVEGRTPNKGFATAMNLDFASVYGSYSFLGYDSVMQDTKQNKHVQDMIDQYGIARTIYEYGVKWVTVSDETESGVIPALTAPFKLANPTYIDNGSDGFNFRIWTLPISMPMAYDLSAPDKALPMKIDDSGVDVTLPASSTFRTVVVNFLYRPFFVGKCNGKPVSISADDWGRITAEVPSDATSLQLRYSPPWGQGFMLGLALLALGSLFCLAPRLLRKKSSPRDAPTPA